MLFSQQLLNFIDKSATPFHAVDTLKKELSTQGYQELHENEAWKIKSNSKYFVTRAEGSICIFNTPKKLNEQSPFHIIGAHTDSPCLKIKNNPVRTQHSYQLLNIEVYGGVLLTSWFDKDLYFGGRIIVEDTQGNLSSHIIRIEKRLRIPRVAIHLDREINKLGFKPNPQEHMCPIIGLSESVCFEEWITSETNIEGKILSWDLFLFDAEASQFGGIDNEFIYAPRLDNLASVHASYTALALSDISEDTIQMAVYFQHEEIGSQSQNGAESNFLEAILKRIHNNNSSNTEALYQRIANSFFISADMAHAIHPCYGGKHDKDHAPEIGKGPVIKSNANMRYATDAFSIAKFKQYCKRANVEFQDFCSRNDIGCGSTIGPMTAAKLGIPSIDIGNPMLSMHSIREMCGTKDHDSIIKVFQAFYDTNYTNE